MRNAAVASEINCERSSSRTRPRKLSAIRAKLSSSRRLNEIICNSRWFGAIGACESTRVSISISIDCEYNLIPGFHWKMCMSNEQTLIYQSIFAYLVAIIKLALVKNEFSTLPKNWGCIEILLNQQTFESHENVIKLRMPAKSTGCFSKTGKSN